MNLKFLQLIIFVFIGNIAFGQADTLVVPSDFDGSPFGSMQKFILGDTLADGSRVNADRYYMLEKDKIYFLDGIFFTDFDFKLIGEPVSGDEKPPIIASTAGADGVIQLIQFKFFADAFVKDVILQMTPPTGTGESNAAFFLSGEGANYEFDNIMIEWGLWTGIVTEKPVNKIVVRNCYFKNTQHKTNIWNGRGIGFFQENPADTVIIQNNTFFNNNAFAFFADISSIPPDYLLFDHNTIVNSMKFPLHSFWLPNATVSNNLFYNAHSYGETAADKVGQDPDLLEYGIINISPIPSDLLDYYSITEDERKYTVANNGFFYQDEIKSYWADYSLPTNPFMNQRVMSMFGDDSGYPNLENNNLVVANPQFVNEGEGMAAMVQWMKNKRDLMGNTYWGWDSDGDKFAVQWPLIEDLSYSNPAVTNASIGGFPLGDLNWWGDDVKEDWEAWRETTSVESLPSEIDAIQVSPNPTIDITNIDISLNAKSNVQISVHNINGSKVAEVINDSLFAGEHSIQWQIHSSIVSGTYLIRIATDNDVVTKKVVVQK